MVYIYIYRERERGSQENFVIEAAPLNEEFECS